MKTSKLQKGFVIGMTTLMFTQSIFAVQTNTGVTFRPTLSGVKKVEAMGSVESNNPAIIAKQLEIAERTVDNLKLNIPKVNRDALVEAMVKNKGLTAGVSAIARDAATNMTNINTLRLNIASLVSDIDISDSSQISRAESDTSFQKEFQISQLALTISPRGKSTNTRNNIEFFLKEVQQLLESKVPRHEVLRLAAETTLATKGFSVDIDSISEAIKTPEGVAGLFKGTDELMSYDIGTPEGGTALSLRLTAKQLEDMEADVQSRVKDLVDLAQNTQDVQKIYAAQSLKQLNSVSDDISRFMVGNTILDASSSASTSARSETAAVQTSIDDLLRELEVLGVEIGGATFKNTFQDVLRSIPAIGKRLAPDRVDRIKSARGKIQEIDKALVGGANKMQENNLQLMKMKGQVIEQRIKLQTEMARAKMSIDLLKQYETYLKSMGDTHTANIIEQDILLRLERDFSASLILYGQMTIATSSIDALVSSNEIIIANANDIRRVAIPAIAIQETLKIANQQTKQVMLQQKAVQAYLATLTVENVKLLKENAELLKQAMSTPMMEAAVIGQAIQDLVNIQQQSRLNRAEAAATMGRANQEMIAVVNQIQKLNLDPVGNAVDSIMNGQKQNRN